MSAAKRAPKPTVQRVAKHLYRRGNSFEFRKVIPPYARGILNGVTTYSKSFGDVSRREADHMAAECRRMCDRLIAAAGSLADPTAALGRLGLAEHVPDRTEIDRAVRGWVLLQADRLSAASSDRVAAKRRVRELDHLADLVRTHQREGRHELLLSTQWAADSLVTEHRWDLSRDVSLHEYLFDRVGRAQREVAIRARAEINFDDRPAPTHAMFDDVAYERDQREPEQPSIGPVPIMEAFAGYCAEREPTPKTVKKWKTALQSLIDHVKHDDLTRISPEDVIGWKNVLLAPSDTGERSRGQATVRNGYIGAVKPVFGWATTNKLIPANPAAGVTVSVPKRVINRTERGYTQAEAKIVLSAASGTSCDDPSSYGAFARRWIPWLCAYTGARVVEIAQLRRADVTRSDDGIWYISIKPNAGSVKSGKARNVAIHPHLLEQGFISAVEAREGPLFFAPSRRREGSTGNTQAQKAGQRIADWVRVLGLVDDELQPNHGWRHAFITLARQIGMDADVRHAITGHAESTEHQKYGNVPLVTMARWMKRFPRYET